MVIFDFDKTLINKDTLFGFYKLAHGEDLLFNIKRLILVFFAIIYKLKIISNDKLKAIGIFLFIRGKSKTELEEVASEYAKQLELNSLYHNTFLKYPKPERIVISASPEIYLKKVFPEENLIGTTLFFKNNKLKGLKFNCYGHNKLKAFKELYPEKFIKKVYSDSNTDRSLLEKNTCFYKVYKGEILN